MFLMLVFYVCVFLCAASCVINDDDDDKLQYFRRIQGSVNMPNICNAFQCFKLDVE